MLIDALPQRQRTPHKEGTVPGFPDISSALGAERRRAYLAEAAHSRLVAVAIRCCRPSFFATKLAEVRTAVRVHRLSKECCDPT